MKTEKLREKMGFIVCGKKVNTGKFKTQYLILSGLLVLAGTLMALFPNAVTDFMRWSYATWASLKWIPNATLNSWIEWLCQTSISIVSQYMLQISLVIIFQGPAVLLYIMYAHATKS